MTKLTPVTPYHHGDLAEALLQAAARIVEQAGLEALTLRACAREAGVSHAAPAHHFGDRAGLLTAYATQLFRQLAQELAAALEAEGQAWPRLQACGQAYIAFALARPAAFRLMFRPDALQVDDADYQAAAEHCLELVAQAVAALLPPAVVAERTVLLWSFLHGYACLLIDGHFHNECLPELAPLAPAELGARLLNSLQALFGVPS